MQRVLSRSQDQGHVGGSRVRRKSGRSSEVLREQSEKSKRLPKKLFGTHQEDHCKSRSFPGVRWSIAKGSSDVCRKFTGSSSEEALDAPKQVTILIS